MGPATHWVFSSPRYRWETGAQSHLSVHVAVLGSDLSVRPWVRGLLGQPGSRGLQEGHTAAQRWKDAWAGWAWEEERSMALPPDGEAPSVLPWAAMASAGSNCEPLLEKPVTRAISYGGGMRVPRLSQDKVQVRVGLGVPSTDQGRFWRGPLTPLRLSLGPQRMQLFGGGGVGTGRGATLGKGRQLWIEAWAWEVS